MKTLRLRAIGPVLFLCAAALASAQSVKVLADREAARRQAHIPQGQDLVARGQTELEAHQFAQSHEDFRRALNYIPPGNSAYQSALDGFCESGVKLAEQRTAEGTYAEAEQLLNEVLSERYNPTAVTRARCSPICTSPATSTKPSDLRLWAKSSR
jgi:tetratricopeptide (TPR) repeat protein